MRLPLQFIVAVFLFFTNFSSAQLDPGMTKKSIQITSSPAGAKIYLKIKSQYELLGTTPLKREIKIGPKELKCTLDGYEDFFAIINTHKTSKLHIKLMLIPTASLFIKTNEPEAAVFLNGLPAGQSNQNISKLKLGKYLLEVHKNGFAPIKETIELNAEKTFEFSFTLQAQEQGIALPVILTGTWITKRIGDVLPKYGFGPQAKLTFTSHGTFIWEYTIQYVKYKMQGKVSALDLTSSPNKIDFAQTALLNEQGKPVGIQVQNLHGIIEIQKNQLRIIFYSQTFMPRPEEFGTDSQIYAKVYNPQEEKGK